MTKNTFAAMNTPAQIQRNVFRAIVGGAPNAATMHPRIAPISKIAIKRARGIDFFVGRVSLELACVSKIVDLRS
jgi:hypothetical protein